MYLIWEMQSDSDEQLFGKDGGCDVNVPTLESFTGICGVRVVIQGCVIFGIGQVSVTTLVKASKIHSRVFETGLT